MKTITNYLAILLTALVACTTRAATTTITPSMNVQAAINAAKAGDVLTFSPGTYNVSKVELKPGVIYDGGNLQAVIQGPANDISFQLSSGSAEFRGFAHTKAGFVHVTGGAAILYHDNWVHDLAGDGLHCESIHDSHIDYNTFERVTGWGVITFPAANCSIDYNDFDYVFQPVHSLGGNKCSISHNRIRHATRHGIEDQGGTTNSQFNYNWLSDFLPHVEGGNDSHMALSLPSGEGGNNEIVGNIALQTGPSQAQSIWAKAVYEIAGTNWVIRDNYAYNWGPCVLNQKGTVSGGNNIYVGVGTTPTLAGDKRYALDDKSAPPWPAMPTAVGRRNPNALPPVILVPAVVTAPASNAVLGLTGTSTPTSITWSFNAATDAGTFTTIITGNGQPQGQAIPIAKGQTAVTVTGLLPRYEYTGTLTIAGKVQSLTRQCLTAAGDAKSINGTPATPTAVAAALAAVDAAQKLVDADNASLATHAAALAAAKAALKAAQPAH